MAIQNFLRKNSYTKISNISLDVDNKYLNFKVTVYKDYKKKEVISKNTYRILDNEFDSFYSVDKISEKDNNLIKSIYSYLKDKEEFQNLKDC